jgi:putative ABC transport system substrate-binding protein
LAAEAGGDRVTTRRELLIALGASTLASPFTAFAQQPGKIQRIGVLLYNSPQLDPIAPLLQGLQSFGYVEGKTATIDFRYAEGKAERLPELAQELVRLKPDVIFAYGGDVAPHVKKVTDTIPIVVMVSNDPVQSGLVASLGRPGANVTGLTLIYDELAGKILELFKEAVPSLSRVAVLWNPDHADPEFRQTQRAAASLNVKLQSLEVRRATDFEPAFKAALAERAQGLIIVSTRLLFQQRKQIAEFGTKNRIPMAGGWGDWIKDGFLLTYGPNVTEAMQRIPAYIDKILKGARPADLPIERPTRFELVIDMKIAKTLNIKIPNSVLVRADKVIE